MRVIRWVLVSALALPMAAQSPEVVPAIEERPEHREAEPERVPPSFKIERVPFKRDKGAGRASAPASQLMRLRAVATKAGEAVVELDRERLTLRPGDLVGTDVVRIVDEGLVVLDRPAPAGQAEGAAVVVVRFDASGRPRLRVVYEQAPASANPAGAP